MKKTLILFVILAFVMNVFAQKSNIDKAYFELNKTGQVELKITIPSTAFLLELTQTISIDNVNGGFAYACASKRQFKKFLQLTKTFEVISSSGEMKSYTMAYTVEEMANWDRYPTFGVLQQMMINFATDYPAICQLHTIGYSQDGRIIQVLEISENIGVDEDKPEFLYTGQMHGDEILTSVLLLHLIDHLLENYGTDSQITNLINNIEIWINPMANPDGAYGDDDDDISGCSRYLANGVDANRNFPNPLAGDHPDGEAWALETVDMMAFSEAHDFVMSANTHTGADVVNYPWDTWASDDAVHANPDDNWWQFVSNIYASNAIANGIAAGFTGYFTSISPNGYIEGYDWYPAFGTRQDYMNYNRNCKETTIEQWSNTNGLINVEDFPAYWDANKQALLDYLDQVLYGIRGIITSSCTGNPIKAKIEIIGHDIDNTHIYSSLPIGNYHRLIYDGSYSFTFSAPGYVSQTITITAANNSTVVQNVILEPEILISEFIADETVSCSSIINFTCLTGYAETWLWDFGDGGTSTLENPSHSYISNGNYTVSLIVTNCGGNFSDTTTIIDYIFIDAPAAPNTQDTTTCDSTSILLTVYGSGIINWYDNEINGNLLYSGNTYTTPILTAPITYYVTNVEADTSAYYVGSTMVSSNGAYHNSTWYLLFNAFDDLTINTVEVNAETAGDVTVQLLDFSGMVLQTANVAVAAGISRIVLNFDVPQGNNYGMALASEINLWRNDNNVNYPYEVADIMQIETSSAGEEYYYYFYNWEIETSSLCTSMIVPIHVSITPIPTAAFTYTNDDLSISFINNSIDAMAYFWDFGDGATSTETNPTHVYSEYDSFLVELTASNLCGNNIYIDSVLIGQVAINDVSKQSVFLFPNPVHNFLTINNEISNKYQLEFYDMFGKSVKTITSTNNKISIDISDLNKGLYIIKIVNNSSIIIKKILIE